MTGDRVEASLVLVWGQLGNRLQRRDAERLLAAAQADPDYFLAVVANREHMAIIELMRLPDYVKNPKYVAGGSEPEYLTNPLKDINTVKAAIRAVSENDNLFREVAEFLHASQDMLSTGSFLTGELKNQHAKLLLTGGYDE